MRFDAPGSWLMGYTKDLCRFTSLPTETRHHFSLIWASHWVKCLSISTTPHGAVKPSVGPQSRLPLHCYIDPVWSGAEVQSWSSYPSPTGLVVQVKIGFIRGQRMRHRISRIRGPTNTIFSDECYCRQQVKGLSPSICLFLQQCLVEDFLYQRNVHLFG